MNIHVHSYLCTYNIWIYIYLWIWISIAIDPKKEWYTSSFCFYYCNKIVQRYWWRFMCIHAFLYAYIYIYIHTCIGGKRVLVETKLTRSQQKGPHDDAMVKMLEEAKKVSYSVFICTWYAQILYMRIYFQLQYLFCLSIPILMYSGLLSFTLNLFLKNSPKIIILLYFFYWRILYFGHRPKINQSTLHTH